VNEKYDSIVVGAGIAGLGVAAILSKEAGHRVLVLERYPKPGGRLMSYEGLPQKGWTMDTGLHFIELGEKSAANELNLRVGKEVEWASFSDSVEFWNGDRFVNVGEMVPMTKEDRNAFRALLEKMATTRDSEIEAWDNRSLEEWLMENVPQPSIRELFTDLGMIMTTIPTARDMAAGEVLYIARDNLQKARQVLQASYPLDGMQGLTRGLVETVREAGGDLRTGCEVQEIVIEDRRAVGVRIPAKERIYEREYSIPETETVRADRVICALPIYHLSRILDFNPETSPLPGWWIKRICEIQYEVTGLVGCMIGLSEPVVDPEKKSFFTALRTKHAQLPFQGLPASNFSPRVAPPGKQLLQTDVVCEHPQVSDRFKRERLLSLMWEDVKEMFPGIEGKVVWKVPYYVDGCDGLARKPGLVGRFKPDLRAPGIPNLFFAGDTYTGRGLATNGAARSAMLCADLILSSGGS